MFGPKPPLPYVVQEYRKFCDDTALGVLSNFIESGAHAVDLTISAEQKRRYLDLWANMAFLAGSHTQKGRARRLCEAALNEEIRLDPQKAELQAILRDIWDRTKYMPAPAHRHVREIIDAAFGQGAFDHEQRVRGMPGADLAMCVRASDHLASRLRF